MATTSINLVHGDDIKVELNISGIDQSDTKIILKKAFAMFMKSVSNSATHNSNEDIIENAFMETYAQLQLEQAKNDYSKKDMQPTESNEEIRVVRKSDSIKSMEELLKDIDPRTYRNYNGVWRFQVYYICESCHHKGKAYVEQRPTFNCRECGYTMKLIPATDNPFPFNDEFGNFYVAGKYKKSSEHAKMLENQHHNDNVYQFKLEQEMAESDDSQKSKKLQVK